MSLYGSWKDAVVTSPAVASAAVDLGRDFDFLEIVIPSLTACTVGLQVSRDNSNWDALGDGITTSAGTHDYADVFKLGGWQFIKVTVSVAQTATFYVRGMRF